MAEKKAYSQAVLTGKYDKASGLLGKYDNVRRFWEDQVSGIFLRPAFSDLVESKKRRLERILELYQDSLEADLERSKIYFHHLETENHNSDQCVYGQRKK